MNARSIACLLALTTGASLLACGPADSAQADPAPANEFGPPDVEIPDPCALLTFAEVEQYLGRAPLSTETPDVGTHARMCTWMTPSQARPIIGLHVTTGAMKDWDAFVEYMVEGEWGDPRTEGQRVDVGRFGYLTAEELQVHTEQGWLLDFGQIRGAGASEGVLELARLAVGRLP
ncbi:MAG: hypothetical protein R3E10_12540 [Gemmatimonadota bacterium]